MCTRLHYRTGIVRTLLLQQEGASDLKTFPLRIEHVFSCGCADGVSFITSTRNQIRACSNETVAFIGHLVLRSVYYT